MRPLLAAALAAAALLARSTEARACSCIPPRTFTSMLAPFDGQTGVPVNTKLWVGVGHVRSDEFPPRPDGLRLMGQGEAPVEFTLGELASDFDLVFVLTPAAPLERGARYELFDGDLRLSSFLVDTPADTTPPAIPRVVDVDSHRSTDWLWDDSCGPSAFVSFSLEHDGVVMVGDRERTSSLEPGGPSGEVTHLTEGPVMSFGRMACSTNWEEAAYGATTTVRFGAFDLAGNFSGFGEPEHGRVGDLGCGCGGDAGALGLVALLSLALARRRATATASR
jgi:hypothetical protein